MSSIWNEEELKRRKIGWYFPSNNGGSERGFDIGNVEKWNGLTSLTREVIQNSLDARQKDLDKNLPVEVEFSFIKMPTKEIFPFADEYLQRISNCLASSTTNSLLEHAKAAISAELLPILKISDYNTTGLTDPYPKDEKTSSFYSLLKREAISSKGNGTGGQYGLGKIAPFLCSDLWTVLYYSYNIDDERAFQGKGLLATHNWNDTWNSASIDESKTYKTTREGYLGYQDNLKPIINKDCDLLPKLITERKRHGTDLFIMGLSKTSEDTWYKSIKYSILSDFFVAINEGKLSCSIINPDGKKTMINKSNLDNAFSEIENEIIEKGDYYNNHNKIRYLKNLKDIVCSYYAYKHGTKFLPKDSSIPDAEKIIGGSVLYVMPYNRMPEHLRPSKANIRKSNQAFIRALGMTVFRESCEYRIPSSIVYTVSEGMVNNTLYLCEPSRHDRWDYKIIEEGSGNSSPNGNRQAAKNILKTIERWIFDSVSSFYTSTEGEFDSGLGRILPMGDKRKTGPIPVSIVGGVKKGVQTPNAKSKDAKNNKGKLGIGANSLVQKQKDKSRLKTPNTQLKEDPEQPVPPEPPIPHLPNPTPHPRKQKSYKEMMISDLREVAFKSEGKGIYALMFTPLSSAQECKLNIGVVGDGKEVDQVKIKDAVFLTPELADKKIIVKDGEAFLPAIQKNKRIKIKVSIDYEEIASLYVSIKKEDYSNA